MALSKFDVEAVHEIMSGHGTWFSAELLRLIAKADSENRRKLAREYPQHVRLVSWWREHRADDPTPYDLAEEE